MLGRARGLTDAAPARLPPLLSSPLPRQDIRNFFGPKGGAKPAAKKKAEPPPPPPQQGEPEGAQAAKRAKVEADPAKSQPKPSQEKVSPLLLSKPGEPAPGEATKKRKVIALDDDGGDGDFVPMEVGEELRSPPRAAPKKKASPAKGTPKRKKVQEEPDAALLAIIRKVDEAAARLPDSVAELKFSLNQAEVNFYAQNDETPPPREGQKPVPQAAPRCFEGKTFVITGTLDSLWRQDAVDLIKRYGGRVTSAVSGKTTYLLAGTESGHTKVNAARQHKTKVIDEDGLFALLQAAPPALAPKPKPPPPPPSLPAAPRRTSDGNDLWVNKHRPQRLGDLIGNNSNVQTLERWLQSWHRVHVEGGAPPSSGRAKDDMGKKAVLLCGPPGVGKTSAATLVCRKLGFDVLEVNASDARGKADRDSKKGMGGKLSNMIKEKVTNRNIRLDGRGTQSGRSAIIMDECDGMSGSDRGGMADLVDTIKKSKQPIICICNDKCNQKMKPLRNVAMELSFSKPRADTIAKRMLAIARAEGLDIQPVTMETLAASTNGDIRMILGQLQQIRLSRTAFTYDDAKAAGKAGKDANVSPFTATDQLFSASSRDLSVSARSDLVFQDMDLVPLLVQENYVNHRPSLAGSDIHRLKFMAKAADAISLGDVANSFVRGGNWGSMPFASIMSAVCPTTYMRGGRETFNTYERNFNRFSAWLGNNSSRNKHTRLLHEVWVKMHCSGLTHCGKADLNKEYVPALRHVLTGPQVERGKEGISEVLAVMNTYCLNREDYDSVLELNTYKSKAPWNADPLKGIPTAVKSAFTRQVNKGHGPLRAGAAEELNLRKSKGKGKGKKKAAVPLDELDPDEDPQGDESEEEEEVVLTAKQRKLLNLQEPAAKPKKGSKGRGGGTSSRGRRGRGGKKK